MTGKIAKWILYLVGGVSLVLFAAFIYLNNDLSISEVSRAVGTGVAGKLPGTNVKTVEPPAGSEVQIFQVDKSDVTKPGSDSELDAVFDSMEPADNFDDLIN